MSLVTQFFKLTKLNIKRLSKYFVSIIIATVLLLVVCGTAGFFVSKNLYQEKTFEHISIGYYIPEGDEYYNYAMGIVGSLEGMADIISLTQVTNLEKGYDLIDNGDLMYLLVAPEDFFTSVLEGSNLPIEIVVRDNVSIGSYIVNELFISYAKYLGIAQAAVYSELDTLRNHELDPDLISAIQDKVNTINLSRALNKSTFITEITATNESSYSLDKHYMAAATMLALFLMSIVFLPVMQSYTNGMKTRFKLCRIDKVQLYISHVITSCIALYVSFLICYISISVIYKYINIKGLVSCLLPIMGIALIVALIGTITKDNFSGNMTILLVAIIIIYIGGGLIPNAMLPNIIQRLSDYLPGKYILSGIANALFGGAYAS